MRIAVLIDAENIPAERAPAVMAKAHKLGDPNIVRLYGDFTQPRLGGWLELARGGGWQPVLQLSGGRAKNSTDISLAIDAMDILHGGAADAFCIVSDDRDFVPLVTRLRAAGKRVYVMCRTPDSRLERISSGVFPLLPAAKPVVAKPAVAKPVAKAVKEPPIVAAFREIAGSGPLEMSLASAGQALRKHAPELVPAGGKGTVRKLLRESGYFVEVGAGPTLGVRLKA